jgi:hypothetical protein
MGRPGNGYVELVQGTRFKTRNGFIYEIKENHGHDVTFYVNPPADRSAPDWEYECNWMNVNWCMVAEDLANNLWFLEVK